MRGLPVATFALMSLALAPAAGAQARPRLAVTAGIGQLLANASLEQESASIVTFEDVTWTRAVPLRLTASAPWRDAWRVGLVYARQRHSQATGVANNAADTTLNFARLGLTGYFVQARYSLAAYVPTAPIVPYVAGGAGVLQTRLSTGGDARATTSTLGPGLRIAAGGRYPVGDGLALLATIDAVGAPRRVAASTDVAQPDRDTIQLHHRYRVRSVNALVGLQYSF